MFWLLADVEVGRLFLWHVLHHQYPHERHALGAKPSTYCDADEQVRRIAPKLKQFVQGLFKEEWHTARLAASYEIAKKGKLRKQRPASYDALSEMTKFFTDFKIGNEIKTELRKVLGREAGHFKLHESSSPHLNKFLYRHP